jgi:DNA-binding transcriptional MocR family regulator
MNRGSDANLYEQVAERLIHQVDQGVYQPGERVPSVREASARFKVSISTVVEAYRVLESRGVIESRPQSGFYVRARQWESSAEPETSAPLAKPCAVSVGELAMTVLRASTESSMVQLGVAAPHPDFLPVRALNRIVAGIARQDDGRAMRYDFPPGNRELRVQIARRMAAAGCDVSPDDIVTTSGCQEALRLCLRVVAKPGDTVAIESPAFYGTVQAIEALGLRALEIPTHPREGISLEALKLALEQWKVAAVMLVPSFSNPLGSCMSEENRRRVVRLLTQHDIPLIEDDVYGDLAFGSTRPNAIKAYDRKGGVLYCSSFSKTLAPGMRVGWAVPGRYRDQVAHRKYVSSMATATLPQMAIAEYLAQGGYERHLRKVRATYAQQAQRMVEAIARNFPAGTRVTRPSGGFVLWVELPEKVDALVLHRHALEKGISIAPGPLFSASGKYRNFIRLSCALPWDERLERALVTLGGLAETLA